MTNNNRYPVYADIRMSDIISMIKDKNERYGDSVVNPHLMFPTEADDPVDLVCLRISDKFARMRNQLPGEDEDLIQDIIGYLLFLCYLTEDKRPADMYEYFNGIKNQCIDHLLSATLIRIESLKYTNVMKITEWTDKVLVMDYINKIVRDIWRCETVYDTIVDVKYLITSFLIFECLEKGDTSNGNQS